MPESTMTPEPSVTETPSPTTYRSLVITDEDRCSDYDADDYSYPQSVEADIVAGLGGIIYSPYTLANILTAPAKLTLSIS